MTQAILVERSAHWEAIALVEEMAFCLGLPLDYVRDIAERVTGQSWDNLCPEHAEAVVDLLAEALHYTLAKTGTTTDPTRAYGSDQQNAIARSLAQSSAEAKLTLRRRKA